MRRNLGLLVPARASRSIAILAFAFAFLVRAYWAMRVQSPLAAVYSDMGGYVTRAEGLLAGTTPDDPRLLLMWPWGTHVIVAGELWLFGRQSPLPIALVHAAASAIAAPCAVFIAARFVRSRLTVLGAGLAVALWHPHAVFAGFFSSETWYSSSLLLFSLFLIRHFERKSGALAAGAFLAIAFACRPQILMTCGMIAVVVLVGWLRRPSSRPQAGIIRFVWPLVVPVVLTMIGSGIRYHRLDGHWGLIASNEAAQRLFGETSVGKIDAQWTAPNGHVWSWWVSPSTKHPVKPEDAVFIRGFVYDATLLGEIRKERLRGVTLGARLRRMADNVALLAVRNVPWPEDDFRRFAWRNRLQHGFATALLPVLVLSVLGLFFLQRHRIASLIIVAHLVTIVIVAAIYLGEARYRVPYDPLILVVAMVGVDRIVRGAHGLLAPSISGRKT